MTIVELFNVVQNTAGTNAKKQILKDNMSPLVKAIFEAAYGEHKYFVTKLDRQYRDSDFGTLTIEDGWFDFEQLLQQCESRQITGNEARDAINMQLDRFTFEDQVILYNILQHNLKIGVSADNFYSIVGKPTNEHKVSLAENLKNAKGVNPVDGTYLASRKLDGVRCTTFVQVESIAGVKTVSSPMFKSRQNKEFTTLDNLREPVRELAANLPEGRYVFDGECCILDENGDEHFDWIMTEITRKNHTISNPCYNIFDLVTEEEFYGRAVSPIFSVRLAHLKDLYSKYLDNGGDQDRIHILKQERLLCQADFDRWSEYVKKGNWEGFMLRKDVAYKPGRSKDLLKVKTFVTNDYCVIGTINGKVTYNEDGQKEFDACTALVVEHKGNKVYVGSGLSKEQRLRWFDHPEEIVGQCIRVQYFEETQDKKTKQYSLRFPVLNYIYGEKRFDAIDDGFIE